ncbi:MAG: hypothetical protein J5707_05685 [Candidatus Methanomethylophilus sp.]|nr:hypothetical protein [Methanomethylophilus sp.]
MAALTVRDVTVKERILLHLSKFSNVQPGQEYNVPFDLTQDGIAVVAGITRSHASLDLKRLMDQGMITNWQAHQKGVRSKRLVYSITTAGMRRAESISEKLIAAGIDPEIFLDMKRCTPEIKWNALDARDRETFGRACVLRIPIPRDEFPPTKVGNLPSDVCGNIMIPPETSRDYLEKIPADEIAKWHSWAADWWLEHDNAQERLYHLINAGRNLESVKLVIRHGDEFMSNPNEDLLNLLSKLKPTDDYLEDVTWIRSQVAIPCMNIRAADECSRILHKLRSPLERVVTAQIQLLQGNYRSAYELGENSYYDLHLPVSAVVVAKACLAMNDLQGADAFAVSACDAMREIGDAKDIDEILKVRAEIAYRRGHKDEALALLGKANAAAPPYRQKVLQNLISALSEPAGEIRFG